MFIGILSDTHGYLDPKLFDFFAPCDEVWHGGDWGSYEETAVKLKAFKPLRGVYGNIDGQDIRIEYPERLVFEVEGLKVFITHIGGYPGHYSAGIMPILLQEKPKLFICGHSHILKVMRDEKLNNMLHINPGAAGVHGFHKVRTAIRLHIEAGRMHGLEVMELGPRA